MLKRNLILLGLAVLVAATASCIFDPKEPDNDDDDDKPDQKFENLTEEWHVLNNLELSYSKRRYDKYDELLDENFTFFFEEGDVGGDVPEQWGRAEELEATQRLFDANLNDPEFQRCKSIEMDLLDEKNVQWIEVVPEEFPEEVWFTANVFYDFKFDLEPDLTLIPFLGSKGQFTIRNAGTTEAPKWQLVQFRDLGASN